MLVAAALVAVLIAAGCGDDGRKRAFCSDYEVMIDGWDWRYGGSQEYWYPAMLEHSEEVLKVREVWESADTGLRETAFWRLGVAYHCGLDAVYEYRAAGN